jgi:CPA1 family monovalent cation:H+ antiporter
VLNEIDFHEAVMHGMLSFLLFAGALHVDFSVFRERSLAIGMMATVGILISTFLVGYATWLLLNFFGIETPFIWALVFGALISPTDPVAVLGLFKTVHVPETLEAKMAGESLFNDGVGVVVFAVVVAIATGSGQGGEVTISSVAELFVTEAVGGAILGLIAGFIGYRTDYPGHGDGDLRRSASVAPQRPYCDGGGRALYRQPGYAFCSERKQQGPYPQVLVVAR